MIYSSKKFTGKRLPFVVLFTAVLTLSACLPEDDYETGGTDDYSSSGSSTFSPLSPVSVNCPSACLGTSLTSACQAACPETQVSSHCVAAGIRYSNYVQNGQAGASAAQLTQLYSQYKQQAELTNQMVRTIGCN